MVAALTFSNPVSATIDGELEQRAPLAKDSERHTLWKEVAAKAFWLEWGTLGFC
jgi:hypothetical protein